ncbi:hypothetical protein [Pelosinus sp. IPA-1]|uniref:hypothetical protein n=1 Tax=Pelosinus sp. IPA-1 TaxID=3029569 RepID=UPI00243615A1|nr:hypothetical protein [Pelosinus sp. IPA-1]GMB00935.1 hypothetical protein PIPA1_37340 [Pelosinus sp. IPA-1]
MYLATFDNQGKRITSYVVGLHKDIPADAIPISDEEQALYATNKYYMGTDGKPTEIPVYVPTADEIKQQKISALDAKYQPQFTELSQALGMATLADNTELIASIKADYIALKIEYDTKRGELDG